MSEFQTKCAELLTVIPRPARRYLTYLSRVEELSKIADAERRGFGSDQRGLGLRLARTGEELTESPVRLFSHFKSY